MNCIERRPTGANARILSIVNEARGKRRPDALCFNEGEASIHVAAFWLHLKKESAGPGIYERRRA